MDVKKFDISNFRYELPGSLIAQEPLKKRDSSRLLAVYRNKKETGHMFFRDIDRLFMPGDCLVLNNTKVMPARLYGNTEKTGAKIEILLLSPGKDGSYEIMMRNSRRVSPGEKVIFNGGLIFTLHEKKGKTVRGVFNFTGKKFRDVIEQYGVMPLPPYIKKAAADNFHKKRYQTVFADREGAKAAPTAGLHFTEKLLERIGKKGVKIVFITLHVGYGTFEEITEKDIRNHKMHEEFFEIRPRAASVINKTISKGKRVIACGTTAMRAIESAARKGRVIPYKGSTSIFIYPGCRFRVVSGLITNFHLPGTTLLALVYAFGGRSLVRKAYEEAVNMRYRFFSYGDAMIII